MAGECTKSLGMRGDNWVSTNFVQSLGSVQKALILGDAALKTALECSFTIHKLRFLGRFALPDLRQKNFHTP